MPVMASAFATWNFPRETDHMKRRHFLQHSLAAGTAVYGAVQSLGASAQDAANDSKHRSTTPTTDAWLWTTLKIGMVREGETLAEKFQVAKDAGFLGVELMTTNINAEEAIAAAEQTGLIIDGTVGGYHWRTRHTDPDPDVRAEALSLLRDGIRKTAAVGADTMLLVPGRGTDGAPDVVMDRAVAAVEAALPEAERSGVKILIENVWNQFLYEHDGPDDQTADAMAAFVDRFDSPLVGMQFDIGNHWKYGQPGDWIRTLGHRVMKLDIKGFSRSDDKFTAITEGDLPWDDVRAALREIGYSGWLAAEVGGGDLQHLKTVRQQMETALHCNEPKA